MGSHVKSASVAGGDEITVIAGGAVVPGLNFAAAAFSKQTGRAVKIAHLGVEAIKRMDDGEVFDLVVHPRNNLEQFFRPAGKVEEGGVGIGRVGVGVMVRPNAPIPDITSADALKRAVLEAESILYTTAASGRYVEAMLRKLGIYGQVKAKTTRYPHGPELMDRMLSGRGKEFGFLPLTEILTYKEKGIMLVGPLPEELQHYLDFMAVPSTQSTRKDLAWEFARFCAGPGKPLLVAHGVA